MYNTSNAASGGLIGSLLGCAKLNYIVHRSCVGGASAGEIEEREYSDMADMAEQKDLMGVQDRQRLRRETRNGALFSAIPHRLNSTELSK